MISDYVKQAITALIATDPHATEDERERVAKALQGDSSDKPLIFRINEVCKRLNKSRTTVYALIKKGLLVPAKGAGDKLKSGVTAASVEAFARGCA